MLQHLGRTPDSLQRHASAIAKKLDDSDGNVRRGAMLVLRTSPEAVAQHSAAIANKLKDEDVGVRMLAQMELVKRPELIKKHIAAITKCLEHSDASVRRSALLLLRLSADKMLAENKLAISSLLKDPDLSVGLSAASALGLPELGVSTRDWTKAVIAPPWSHLEHQFLGMDDGARRKAKEKGSPMAEEDARRKAKEKGSTAAPPPAI